MLNNVCIMGRMTDDPELKTTSSGISVCSFSIACNRPKRNDQDQQADFIDIVAWRHTAEFVEQWFIKGDPIIIQGRLHTRTYEDKNGNRRKAVEIVADSVDFAAIKKGGGQAAESRPGPSAQSGELMGMELTDEDMPF